MLKKLLGLVAAAYLLGACASEPPPPPPPPPPPQAFMVFFDWDSTRLSPASLNVLEAPPVLGAALLGLDHLGASGREKARLQAALTDASLDNRLGRGKRG